MEIRAKWQKTCWKGCKGLANGILTLLGGSPAKRDGPKKLS
jgi:hypothetical protein